MKRAIAMMLTVAMIGALAFAGFAGTAAAHDDSDEQWNYAEVNQDQTVYQEAQASSAGSFAFASGDGAEANTGNTVIQESSNSQTAEVTQVNENIEDSLFIDD